MSASTESGTKRRIALFAVAAVAVAIAIAVPVFVLRAPGRPRAIRIATGQRGGTFLPLGQLLAREWDHDVAGTRFTAIESPGGSATVAMLERNQVQIALLSNHLTGSGATRLIAPLYEETLQIVVRREAGIARADDLRGHRVSVGPARSGTEEIAHSVLDHFGIEAARVHLENHSMIEAAERLERGQLDAAFMVAGMRTPAVDRLLRRTDMQLLSLGEPGVAGSALEGIRLDAPYFAVTTIPERAYGTQPETAVGTISVRALLVARADVPEDLVFELTRALFEHKVELSAENRLLAHLSEHVDLATSPYAVHPGADRYYRRDEPTLLQRYTDQISLMITVGALIWSALSAFAAARRQSRRNRIEHRYGDAQALAAKARQATEPSDLHALHTQLIEMRESVIAELANERLDANDAFVILQHYLTAQLAELERRVDRAERAIVASP